jgi:hypothetical protein
MTHVRCFSVLLLLALIGCVKTDTKDPRLAPSRIDIPAESVMKFSPSGEFPTDVTVNVKGPSVVYVFHAQKLRALVSWTSQTEGQLTVPVARIANSAGQDVYVGVTANADVLRGLQDFMGTGPSLAKILCHTCNYKPDNCCPNQN